jgi:GAF domain-containing protein
MAWRNVVSTANGLGDEGLRRNFLNKPSDSRNVVRAWVHHARQRNMPAAEYECHLTGQTSSKEPYQRMVDAGLRMGEIHTENTLCQFLVEELTELTGAERVLVLFRDGTGQRVAAALLPGDEVQSALLEAIEPWLTEAANTRATRLRHGPPDVAAIDQRSCLVVPMVAQRELLGVIYLDIDGLYGRFHEGDTQMVSVIAAQAAMALTNVRAAEVLEEKVSQRTAEVQAQYEQRAAEIAVINSVQTTLTAEMDLQGIYNAAGDKLREIFAGRDVIIRVFDHATQTIHTPYGYEGGLRLTIPPQPIVDYGYTAHILRTRESIVINENIAEATARYGGYTVEGTAVEKAVAIVPLLTSDHVLGLIYIVDLEREHAFSDSEIRLLKTLANAMTVGLENARLFDETQRLLKESKQAAAEWAIINSVQAALVGELDTQGIYDAVGDKLREIYGKADLSIRIFDQSAGLMYFPYMYDRGERIAPGPVPLIDIGFSAHVRRTREMLVVNEDFAGAVSRFGAKQIPGTEYEKSAIFVPMIWSEEV